ncbi:hypothetical protein [Anatilimnocola floriformis]|uniref:hypothetical protein n=1 Tax=Anatilimnocola floriformis TaxID=2948575 RepID=UPI0020C5375A|nr:hypothetical protein [Anatilimnocola floriformis]
MPDLTRCVRKFAQWCKSSTKTVKSRPFAMDLTRFESIRRISKNLSLAENAFWWTRDFRVSQETGQSEFRWALGYNTELPAVTRRV